MRTHHLIAALSLVAAAALAACVVPLSNADQNCVSYCTLLQGCGSSAAPAADCNAWCTAFAEDLERVGCKIAFDDATSCVVADGTCQAASCDAQTQTYLDCAKQYCDTNPTDEACTGG